MAITPDPINITIDQEALRASIQETLDQVLREVSWRLRQAADQLDPAFMVNLADYNFERGRKQAEAEYEKGKE